MHLGTCAFWKRRATNIFKKLLKYSRASSILNLGTCLKINDEKIIFYFPFTVWSGTSDPLGLEDRTVQDHQMTASSEYPDLYAYKGRLRNTGQFWATETWDYVSPWLQVDFIKPVVITGIQTQGAGTIAQWPTRVQIQYGNDVNALQTILENGSPKVTRLWSCDVEKGVGI